MIKNFKDKAMKLRRGDWFFNKNKILLVNSAIYAGSQISNTAVSYFLITIIFTLVFTILLWPLFWLILKDMFWILFFILLPALIKPILNMIVKSILVTSNSIRFRR